MKINDDLIRQALLIELDFQMNSIPEEFYNPHNFSDKFERKMNAVIRRAARPQYYNRSMKALKRIAAFCVIALTALFVMILSVESMRTRFFEFIEQKYKEFSYVLFSSNDYTLSHGQFEIHIPDVPDDLELKSENTINKVHLYFRAPDGRDLVYQQLWLDETTFGINTENAEFEECTINGYDGWCYYNLGYHTVIWQDGVYSYLVSTNGGKTLAFEVAESISK